MYVYESLLAKFVTGFVFFSSSKWILMKLRLMKPDDYMKERDEVVELK